jgi:hypothetical protein
VVEQLPRRLKALCSNYSTAKKQKKIQKSTTTWELYKTSLKGTCQIPKARIILNDGNDGVISPSFLAVPCQACLGDFLASAGSSCNPPDVSLPSSWDYGNESPHPASRSGLTTNANLEFNHCSKTNTL